MKKPVVAPPPKTNNDMTTKALAKTTSVKSLLNNPSIRKRFEDMLGQKSGMFMASVLSVANTLPHDTDPMSIISSAVQAASLDLPINKDLGFAWIIPYRNKGSAPIAQFQMGWKGFVQLAMRSGEYKTLNMCQVFEGQFIGENIVTGDIEIDPSKKKSDKVVGYCAFMRLTNGFEKTIYWSIEKVKEHAGRFSQGFKSKKGDNAWQTDPDAMSMKTVMKHMLSKFGVLSIQMQRAIKVDQSATTTIDVDSEVSYVDNPPQGKKPKFDAPRISKAGGGDTGPESDQEASEDDGPPPDGEEGVDESIANSLAYQLRVKLVKAGLTEASALNYMRGMDVIDDSVDDLDMAEDVAPSALSDMLGAFDAHAESIKKSNIKPNP